MPTEFKIRVGSSSKNILNVAEILAECGVNLTTVATERVGEDICVRLLTSDNEACTHCLMKADLDYDMRQVMIVEVEDRPGQWAEIAKRLVEAGLEIEASYLLSRDEKRMRFVFAVSDPKKGEEVLRGAV